VKIVRRIAKKILNHCSKCGGCPMAKIMDAQAETGGRDSTTSKEDGKEK